MHRLLDREEERCAPLPPGPTGQVREFISGAEGFQSLCQSTQFIAIHKTKPQEKESDFILVFMDFFFFFIIITHLPKLRIKSYFLSPSSREFPKFLFPMTQSWCQKRCNNKSLQSWGKQDSPFSAQDGSHLHCSQISKYFIYFNRAAQKTQPANREQRVEANKEQRSRSSQSSTRHQEPNQTKT